MTNLTDINAVRALLARHGFSFSKSLGQNFLIAEWVPERIAEEACLDRETGVIEIGPGIGCLTAQLSERAGRVLSIELDGSLKPVLEETLYGRDNVEILYADALKQDFPSLAEEKLGGLKPVVCANLPYNVTSPVLTKLIEAGCFESITVMIQKEVAQRICALPGTADCGAFSLFVQWHCEAEKLFDVSPDCFIPQPKVTSSVIRLVKRKEKPCSVKDEELLFRIIRAAYNQRRKTLVNALSSAFGEYTKAELADIVTECGFDALIRGEKLTLENYCFLSDKISEKSL